MISLPFFCGVVLSILRGSRLAHAAPGTDDQGQPELAERATQEADYGRRGKGYIFGAFRPATGEALTAPYGGRTTADWMDFVTKTEAWLSAEFERVYAVVDNLNAHRAAEVRLFSLAHPRQRFAPTPIIHHL